MANIQSIVADLKQERDRLSQAIAALESIGETRTVESGTPDRTRKVSAQARRRMAQSQKARWAKVRGQAKPATPKRRMSAEAIEKIRRAKKKWWKAKKAAQR